MRGRKALSAVAFAGLLLVAVAADLFAGGPVCPPPVCGPPPMCGAPSFCPPPMCPPQVGFMPPMYATQCPPPCPPPTCGPPPMCCPPRCRVNPLAKVLVKTCELVASVVALPFRVVDCIVSPLCDPPCGPRRMAAACPPPACGPVDMCPPGGPAFGPPGPMYGGPAMTPVRYRPGTPQRFLPMNAKAKKGREAQGLLALRIEGVFGTYW